MFPLKDNIESRSFPLVNVGVIGVNIIFFLGFWFVLQFLQGSLYSMNTEQMAGGGVTWWAHVGGFPAGVALLWVFRCRDWLRPTIQSPGSIRRFRR